MPELPRTTRFRLGSFVLTEIQFTALLDRFRLKGVKRPLFGFLLMGLCPAEIAPRMGWTVNYTRTQISGVLRAAGTAGDRQAMMRRIAEVLYSETREGDPLQLVPTEEAKDRLKHRGGAHGGRPAYANEVE